VTLERLATILGLAAAVLAVVVWARKGFQLP
jgi:hypothetical protein